MANDEKKSDIPSFEMVIELPEILKEPLRLADGTVLSEGDRVEHSQFGTGTIVRIWRYQDVGTCLYIDFGSNVKEEILPQFVRKLQ